MSKESMALLADIVYKQAEGEAPIPHTTCECVFTGPFALYSPVMATELQFFARHANRKAIKTEDVVLCARKHPNLVTDIAGLKGIQYCQYTSSLSP
jgi:hypothetical protein